MKYYSIFLIALLFFSCKKSNYDKYAAGSEKRMTVTEHNVIIEGIHSDGLNSATTLIDLDGDNEVDLKFISNRDSLVLGIGTEFWDVILEIVNPLYDVLEIPNSGDNYYTETPYKPYWGAGFGRSNRTLTTGCQTDGLLLTEASANSPKTLSEHVGFQPDELDWKSNDFGSLELASSGYEFTVCHFNEEEDSLFCDIIVIEPTCYPIPTDEKTYLLFRKLETNDCYSIGWIEVLLTDENKLEIKRSAISNKPLKF
ncbi:MAG: hypothetical protein ACI8ZM_000352 [Crocinitomix sp.]|jgi:hypothetical protein